MDYLPPLSTPQTAHLRADLPPIEYLEGEQDHIGDWLMERKEQLLLLGQEEQVGVNMSRLVSAGVFATAFLMHASPLAPLSLVLGVVSYAHGCFLEFQSTGSFSLLPFVKGNFIDKVAVLGNSELRESQGEIEPGEVTETLAFLSSRERKEYRLLNDFLPQLTEYLTQVEACKRFHAYMWIKDCHYHNRGALPSFDAVLDHTTRVTPDPRLNPRHLKQLAGKKPVNPPPHYSYFPPVKDYEQILDSVTDYQPLSTLREDYPIGKPKFIAPSKKVLYSEAEKTLNSLVDRADQSILQGTIILAEPGTGKTTFLGTAWGRLARAYGTNFKAVAIVVKPSDVEVFRGIAECFCVLEQPKAAAVRILRFEKEGMQGKQVRRLFLDDFLSLWETFQSELRSVFIDENFELYHSKKECPSAQPILPKINAALNRLWLVGREYNTALWVSSHSSNIKDLPFVSSTSGRSVGKLIFLVRSDKKDFITNALSNPNLLPDTPTREGIKSILDTLIDIPEPIILSNMNNWSLGLVPSSINDEYQSYRQAWKSAALPEDLW